MPWLLRSGVRTAHGATVALRRTTLTPAEAAEVARNATEQANTNSNRFIRTPFAEGGTTTSPPLRVSDLAEHPQVERSVRERATCVLRHNPDAIRGRHPPCCLNLTKRVLGANASKGTEKSAC